MPRVILPLVLALGLVGCSAISGSVKLLEEGGIGGSLVVKDPGSEKAAVDIAGKVDVVGGFGSLYDLLKNKVGLGDAESD